MVAGAARFAANSTATASLQAYDMAVSSPILSINSAGCRAPLSFRRMKLRRPAPIAVRHVFPIVFRRTERFNELAEINVDHRRCIEGQKLRQQQSADDRDAERAAQL